MGSAGRDPAAGEPRKPQWKAAADYSRGAARTRSQAGRAQSAPVETADRAALQPATLHAAGFGGLYSVAAGESRHAGANRISGRAAGRSSFAFARHAAPDQCAV